MNDYSNLAIPNPQPVATAESRRSLRIGFPSSATNGHTFPITPESAALLVDRGYTVTIETGAGGVIHYTDEAYTRRGVIVASRRDTLQCDIIVGLDGLTATEVSQMKRGATLLTLLIHRSINPDTVKALQQRHIHTIDLNMVEDQNGHRPFADILTEIEGRAAMTVAAFMLAHPEHGKGIMLGGVTGVIPCEVVVLGADIGARAAAQSALALGTIVRMLDNNPYGLREARLTLGPGVVTSALHPHVLVNSLRSADIVIASGLSYPHFIDAEAVNCMKRGVIVMDLSSDTRPAFPSLPLTDVSTALHPATNGLWGGRVCYTAPGRTVPRTAAMAISNTLIDVLPSISSATDIPNPMKMSRGIRMATCTLRGKVVDPECARAIGERPFDINLLMSCS
ncbi:MAG: hypothetical protein K2M98_08210 [Muribaculum sp.]|nr:hypothetical protein [Muribaculum sp.]